MSLRLANTVKLGYNEENRPQHFLVIIDFDFSSGAQRLHFIEAIYLHPVLSKGFIYCFICKTYRAHSMSLSKLKALLQSEMLHFSIGGC